MAGENLVSVVWKVQHGGNNFTAVRFEIMDYARQNFVGNSSRQKERNIVTVESRYPFQTSFYEVPQCKGPTYRYFAAAFMLVAEVLF